jgi:predicted nucleotidyltransferase
MPEIDFFLFDLKQLFRLFPKKDANTNEKLSEYERHTQECMALNRLKLFTDYGYNSEFDNVFAY